MVATENYLSCFKASKFNGGFRKSDKFKDTSQKWLVFSDNLKTALHNLVGLDLLMRILSPQLLQ